ncbi:hypothetical protein BHM03_00026679 [Ensete ventricosum]|nr:hypothetical protein BHM03_00026679 [Ensete ventricosum]
MGEEEGSDSVGHWVWQGAATAAMAALPVEEERKMVDGLQETKGWRWRCCKRAQQWEEYDGWAMKRRDGTKVAGGSGRC